MTGNYSPDILGLVEIENRRVLEDLVGHKDMKKNGYQIIHFESPDRRGVDVGLLYKPKTFTPFHTKALELQNPADTSFKTRDLLYVKGLFQRKDTLHVFVNHWPSRRGGKEDMRILAGKLARNAVDSILQINPKAKIILMGDFNDDPTNKSIQRELRAIGKEKKMVDGDLFNASYKSFKQGHGSLRYNGASNLFDQIIVSQGFMEKNTDDVFYMDGSFRVFSPNWLFNQSGKDTGTPFRTFSRGVFVGGYSDHLPTFIVIGGK
jgi:endonuclease/exonuclease/phosphatase family metal-dependent hydrolase